MPQIQKYRAKISGPLLDRIDLHIDAPALEISDIQKIPKKGKALIASAEEWRLAAKFNKIGFLI